MTVSAGPESAVRLAFDAAPALGGELIALRRALHAGPELGLELPATQARVLDAIAGLGLEVSLGRRTSSIVAVLRGGGADDGHRPSVLLRADMDALPIVERTGLPFASTNGAMHACGHDLHTAGLVGAARLLAAARAELDGDVIFMFQPGEEGHDGAAVMLEEGVLEAAGEPPVAAYGLHVTSELPSGLFTNRPGAYMAAISELGVIVHGKGGHSSRPHQALDPVQVAAEIVTALQSYVTRRFDVFDPVVLTVGRFQAGSAPNVIPAEAEFTAVIRSFSDVVGVQLAHGLPRLVRGIAEAHGLSADVVFSPRLPVTVNDAAEAGFWARTAAGLFGSDRYESMAQPRMSSEDFSRVLQRVPGSYGHLGAGMPDLAPGERAPLHSAEARFDDGVLADHALFLASLAADRLAESARSWRRLES
ncbi:M20 metallopeptidase family protein [Compostimonas suwonensis]|uniref:Hippurate hydrolase n=1 Tax=Compostimonas suwonensis TaxID=1048394 RepID=A0A2M9C0I8_9MICO|nr:M20 family metallopeptidase [Compostimonas suwonensis]PJJ63812.1 hippurate hydrolase [Compostimonas suwonensis]